MAGKPGMEATPAQTNRSKNGSRRRRRRSGIDIPMRGNSLYLDDELIVDAGELTVKDMRPAAKR